MSAPRWLYHLVVPDEWAQAQRAGALVPPSLGQEGFVHLSFAEQLAASANRHLASARQLLALRVDPRRLDDPVRVEDSYGTGIAHPHLYGPLPATAVIQTLPLHRDADRQWVFDEALDAAGRLSPDGAAAPPSADR